MLSIELLRNQAGLTVRELCTLADINVQTYYNILSGDKNISENVLIRLGKAINMPYMNVLHFLDRLYQSNIKIVSIDFQGIIPNHIQDLILQQHPVFSSKYNSISKISQGVTSAD